MQPVTLSDGKLAVMRKGGAWVPSSLALDARKRPLEQWQRLLTHYYLRSGAATVIVAAHTGEFANGDLDLYGRWLGWVADVTGKYAGEKHFLMAAVSGPDALRQAELAARHDFDIVMVSPTAFTERDDDGVMALYQEIASIIPTFGFELQRIVSGSRPISSDLWDRIFGLTYGAKGASFDTYRSLRMLEAAARSERRRQLVLATGNDDRIVADLGGRFTFDIDGRNVTMTYSAGLLGHLATDTHAAVQWIQAVQAARDGCDWNLAIGQRDLAHRVNVCNGALFDAQCNFENSRWGVKTRLHALGLLPDATCFDEVGRPGLSDQIERAYAAHAVLNDEDWLVEHLPEMKRQVGLAPDARESSAST